MKRWWGLMRLPLAWNREGVLWGICLGCGVGLLAFHLFLGGPMRQDLSDIKKRYSLRKVQVSELQAKLLEARAKEKELLVKREECLALLNELNQRDPYQFVSSLKEKLTAQMAQGDLNVENYQVKDEAQGLLVVLSLRANIRGLVSVLSELETVRGLNFESLSVSVLKVKEGQDLNVVVSCRLLRG